MNPGRRCSCCGQPKDGGIALCRPGEVFSARPKRLDPHWAACERRAVFYPSKLPIGPTSPDARMLVISGSGATGKTTIPYTLLQRHGFVRIDAGGVLELLGDGNGRRADINAIHDYLLQMAEGLVAMGQAVAIAHVVLPEYRRYLRERGTDHRIGILMPRMPFLLHRNAERVCSREATPERSVREFYGAYRRARRSRPLLRQLGRAAGGMGGHDLCQAGA